MTSRGRVFGYMARVQWLEALWPPAWLAYEAHSLSCPLLALLERFEFHPHSFPVSVDTGGRPMPARVFREQA